MKNDSRRMLWDTAIGIVLAALLSWGVWTTNKIFDLIQCDAVAGSDTKAIGKSVDEVKNSVQSIDRKIEEQNKMIKEDQKEMFKLLLDIQKQIKENNKRK